jgi:hypothetical protein
MPYGTPQYFIYLLEISGARKLLEVYSKKNWKRIRQRKRLHLSDAKAALFRLEYLAAPGSIQGVRFTYCPGPHAFTLQPAFFRAAIHGGRRQRPPQGSPRGQRGFHGIQPG